MNRIAIKLNSWHGPIKDLTRIFMLSLCFVLPGLEAKTDEAPAYFFEHFTTKDGLADFDIHDMLEDHQGFIWLSTHDGIMRFDGYGFKNISICSRDGNSNTNSFDAIIEDKRHNLWASGPAGLYVKKNQLDCFVNLSTKSGFKAIAQKHIISMLEDSQDRIWFLTFTNELFIKGKNNNEDIFFPYLQKYKIAKIVKGKGGGVWALTDKNTLLRIDAHDLSVSSYQFRTPNGKPFNGLVRSMYEVGQGKFYMGTEKDDLIFIDFYNKKLEFIPLQKKIFPGNVKEIGEMAVYNESKLLVSTAGNGLIEYDLQTGQKNNYLASRKNKGAIYSNNLNKILIDRQGNIWIESFGSLNLARAERDVVYPFFGNTEELEEASVLSVKYTPKEIWLGTDGKGLFKYNDQLKQFTHIDFFSKGKGSVVKSIFQDKKGRIWFGFYKDGLACLDSQSGKLNHFFNEAKDSLFVPFGSAWSFAEDQLGNIWVAALGYGLVQMNERGKIIQLFRHNGANTSSLSSNDVLCVWVDQQGYIWVGTESDGVCQLDVKSNKFVRFNNESSNHYLPGNKVRCIYEDHNGRLFVGMDNGGIAVRDGENFRKLEFNFLGLRPSVISIAEDKSGNLWFTTFDAVYKTHYQNGKLNKLMQKYISDGDRFNYVALDDLPNGGMIIGSRNGIYALNKESVAPQRNKHWVIITGVFVESKQVINGRLNTRKVFDASNETINEIRIAYSDRSFAFEYALANALSPQKNHFAYRLDNYEPQGFWHYTAVYEHKAEYHNLRPGHYTFRIRGIGPDGNWSKETKVKIIVEAEYWQSWYFKVLLGLFLLFSFWSAMVLYTRHFVRHLKKTKNYLPQDLNLEEDSDGFTAVVPEKTVLLTFKKELLGTVKDKIGEVKNLGLGKENELIEKINQWIDVELQNENNNGVSLTRFDKDNQHFMNKMALKYPNLTQNDLLVCSLIRSKYDTKEMAKLLNISVAGVQKCRHRLKKKLNLKEEDNLYSFLFSV